MLATTNVSRPKGQLTDAEQTWQIETNDQLRRAELYRPLIVAYRSRRGRFASPTSARPEDSMEDVRNAGMVNGKPAVLVIVFRQPGANIIETVDRVRAPLPQLQAAVPGR